MSILSEKQLNVIRASGYIFTGVLNLQRIAVFVEILFALALVYFTLNSDIPYTAPVLWIIIAIAVLFIAWGTQTILNCNEALTFTAWMRKKERVQADIDKLTCLFRNKDEHITAALNSLNQKFSSILAIEKVNKATLKEKINELKETSETIKSLRDEAEEYKELFGGGLSVVDSLTSSFTLFGHLLLGLGFVLFFYTTLTM